MEPAVLTRYVPEIVGCHTKATSPAPFSPPQPASKKLWLPAVDAAPERGRSPWMIWLPQSPRPGGSSVRGGAVTTPRSSPSGASSLESEGWTSPPPPFPARRTSSPQPNNRRAQNRAEDRRIVPRWWHKIPERCPPPLNGGLGREAGPLDVGVMGAANAPTPGGSSCICDPAGP